MRFLKMSIVMKRPHNFPLRLIALPFFVLITLFFAAKSGILSSRCQFGDSQAITNREMSDQYYLWSTNGQQGNIRQRLAEYVPYDPNARWDRNLVQAWHSPVNTSTWGYLLTWEEFFSDFNRILYISNSTAKEYVKSINRDTNNLRDLVRAYIDLLDMVVLRADLFRYLAVWMQGGVYSDMDTYVTQPFNKWLAGDGYSVTEPPPPIEVLEQKIGMVVGIEGGKHMQSWGVAQFMFGAKRGHPILLEIIARIVEKAGELSTLVQLEKIREEDIISETGPGVMTRVVEEWIKKRYDASFNIRHDLPIIEKIGPTLIGDVLILPPAAINGWPDGEPRGPGVYLGHSAMSTWRFESDRN